MSKVKYAIYKGSVGLYAMEYFDTWDAETFRNRGVLGYHHIKPEDLPIVVNRNGGRHSFYPTEDNFVEFREVDEDAEPLTREERYPKNSKEFKYGWIDPEGNTYNTGHEGHLRAADTLCEELYPDTYVYDAERKLEESGWVKVTKEPFGSGLMLFSERHRITKKQADTLIDLGYSSCDDFKEMIEVSEPEW